MSDRLHLVGSNVHDRPLRLGIPTSSTNRLAHSSAYQAVTIPASAPAPVILSYAQRAGGGSDGYDYRETLLLNADFSYLARVERNYAAGNDQWTVRQFDLTAYRGRPVVFYFNVYNNGGRTQMWNYMDNVVLGSCPPSAAVAQVESDSTWKESTLVPAAVTGVELLQVGSAQVVLDDAGGEAQAVIAVDVQRAGQSIAWQAAADVTWLRLEANQGETPGLLTVAVDGVGLPWGQYHATIHMQDALAAAAGQTITVEYIHGAGFRLYLPAVQQ